MGELVEVQRALDFEQELDLLASVSRLDAAAATRSRRPAKARQDLLDGTHLDLVDTKVLGGSPKPPRLLLIAGRRSCSFHGASWLQPAANEKAH